MGNNFLINISFGFRVVVCRHTFLLTFTFDFEIGESPSIELFCTLL